MVREPENQDVGESVALLWQRLRRGQEAYSYFYLLCSDENELPNGQRKDFVKAALSTLDVDWQEQIKTAAKSTDRELDMDYVRMMAQTLEASAKRKRKHKSYARKSIRRGSSKKRRRALRRKN